MESDPSYKGYYFLVYIQMGEVDSFRNWLLHVEIYYNGVDSNTGGSGIPITSELMLQECQV